MSAAIQRDLEPLTQAIALFKELESWGADDTGRKFTFEVAQMRFTHKHVLVGIFDNGPTGRVPTMIVGVDKDEYLNHKHDFRVYMTWTEKDSPSSERIEDAKGGGSKIFHCMFNNVREPILDFVRTHMSSHPRYKQIQAEAAQRVMDGIEPQSFAL